MVLDYLHDIQVDWCNVKVLTWLMSGVELGMIFQYQLTSQANQEIVKVESNCATCLYVFASIRAC